jgi:hypothetical protein
MLTRMNVLDVTFSSCMVLNTYINKVWLGANTHIGAKTMSNNGENYELFYICFFLEIFKLCEPFQVMLND